MIRGLPNQPLPTALVVFVDHTECRWLHGLKRGFRHCFAAVECEHGWLVCDSLKHRIELSVFPRDLDLAGLYAALGYRVLRGRAHPPAAGRSLAIAPLTCVEITKRLLGLQAPLVLTPWQLFRHLQRPCAEALRWRLVPVLDAAAIADSTLTRNAYRTINLHINGRATFPAERVRRPDPAS